MTDARLTLSGIPVGEPTVRAISPTHPSLGDFTVDLGLHAALYVTRGYLTALRDACTAALEARS